MKGAFGTVGELVWRLWPPPVVARVWVAGAAFLSVPADSVTTGVTAHPGHRLPSWVCFCEPMVAFAAASTRTYSNVPSHGKWSFDGCSGWVAVKFVASSVLPVPS
jgi:hypothetical protein